MQLGFSWIFVSNYIRDVWERRLRNNQCVREKTEHIHTSIHSTACIRSENFIPIVIRQQFMFTTSIIPIYVLWYEFRNVRLQYSYYVSPYLSIFRIFVIYFLFQYSLQFIFSLVLFISLSRNVIHPLGEWVAIQNLCGSIRVRIKSYKMYKYVILVHKKKIKY